jgi:hypothetical protein
MEFWVKNVLGAKGHRIWSAAVPAAADLKNRSVYPDTIAFFVSCLLRLGQARSVGLAAAQI